MKAHSIAFALGLGVQIVGQMCSPGAAAGTATTTAAPGTSATTPVTKSRSTLRPLGVPSPGRRSQRGNLAPAVLAHPGGSGRGHPAGASALPPVFLGAVGRLADLGGFAEQDLADQGGAFAVPDRPPPAVGASGATSAATVPRRPAGPQCRTATLPEEHLRIRGQGGLQNRRQVLPTRRGRELDSPAAVPRVAAAPAACNRSGRYCNGSCEYEVS